MKTCAYTFRNKEKCAEEVLKDSEFCILHVDLPEDESSEEFKRINKLKEKKVEEKVGKEDFNFEGARLFEVDFSGMKIKNSLNFIQAVIRKDALFERAEIGGNALFDEVRIGGNARFSKATIDRDAVFMEATIGGNAQFEEATIGESAGFWKATIDGDASFDRAEIGGDAGFGVAKIGGSAEFEGAKICGDARFGEATIGRYARFSKATIDGDASFWEATIGGNASFWEATIGGNAQFEEATIGESARFEGAEIGGYTLFYRTTIGGILSFKDTTFKDPRGQEEACRTAKNIWAKFGDRDEEDKYHYLEMEAKREQKKPIIRFLELILIQKIFRYGTKWEYVLITWFLVVFGFAFFFWIGNGVEGATSLWENIYFSIVTATTLGYGDYHPTYGIYQGLAGILAIFGTFMWAAFIAIFARKYMR